MGHTLPAMEHLLPATDGTHTTGHGTHITNNGTQSITSTEIIEFIQNMNVDCTEHICTITYIIYTTAAAIIPNNFSDMLSQMVVIFRKKEPGNSETRIQFYSVVVPVPVN